MHYHLRGGGVTRVIDTAISALKPLGFECCVIVGEQPQKPLACGAPIGVVDGLGYHSGTQLHDPNDICQAIQDEAERLLGGKPDCWHIHNHHLGKNALTPLVVLKLAAAGIPLLLQPHDFPEDGRPTNFDTLMAGLRRRSAADLGADIYPLAEHIHYCLLNDRDAHFLREAGGGDHIHLLPNAVDLPLHRKAQATPAPVKNH